MTVTSYFLAGQDLNVLAGPGTLSVTSENALFPKENLHAGRPSLAYEFASAGVDDSITKDLNRSLNGDFENALTSWSEETNGAGNDVATEATIVNGGAGAAKLTLATAGASNYARLVQKVSVRAGWEYHLRAAMRGDGTLTMRFRVQCVETGNWLQPGGTWGAEADVFTELGTSYVTKSLTFTTEALATTLVDIVTLRLVPTVVEASATGDAYLDDVYLWPSWDLASVHGHNIAPVVVPQLRKSTDDFAANDDLVSAMTVSVPTFWRRETTKVTARYVRLKFVGTNPTAIRIGELVVGQAEAVTRRHDPNSELSYTEDHLAAESRSRDRWPHALADHPRRSYQAAWQRALTTAAWEQLRDALYRRSRGSLRPLVLVPDDTRTEVLHCRIDDSLASTRRFAQLWATSLIFTEDPFGFTTRS